MRKSVAEKVSRESGGMTLFLKKANDGFVSMADGSINLKNILVPVDIEPDPHLAINAAMKFAGLLGTDLAFSRCFTSATPRAFRK